MATACRRTDPPLNVDSFEDDPLSKSEVARKLFACGFEFEFFQAVRLLARLFPTRKSVGTSARPSEEIVRFASWHSLAFPASSVDYVEKPHHPNEQARLTVTFLGLTGTQGVLPLYFSERLLVANVAKQEGLAAFLNIFHHRLVSLFYRAWQKYRAPVLRETAALRAFAEKVEPAHLAPDNFTHALFDFIGLGTAGLRHRLPIPAEELLPYAGLIAQRPLSAHALSSVLSDRYQMHVAVDQFVGSWSELEPADRTYLLGESESNQLGVAAFLGDRVWDQHARIRLRLGPLPAARFRDFLPGTAATHELTALVRFLVGRSLAFDVQPILQAHAVPQLQLVDNTPDAPRLGWTSWVKTREFTQDAAEAVFTYAA